MGGANGGLRWALGDKRGQRTRQAALADRTGASWRGVRLAGWRVSGGRAPSGWEWNGSQPGQGATDLFPHGQPLGRGRVRRRAERVIRPARAKTRRRRVLVATIRSPRPMRAVQRARLWAITCTVSQAALAAKRTEGRWFSPTPYFRSRMAFSISAWRRWPASSSRVSPLTGVCIWCFPLRDDRFLRVRRRAGMWFRKQQYPCQPGCLVPKRRRKAISLPSPQYLYIPLSGVSPSRSVMKP